MAARFLQHEAEQRGLDVTVRSTGTHAFPGRAATYDGRRIMEALGVPMDDHRTLLMDDELLDWADLVIGLAVEHAREIVRDYPAAAERTFLLKEFLGLLPSLPTYSGDPTAWVAHAAELRKRALRPADLDVDDPYGAREEAYRRVATEIQGLITTLADGLAAKDVRRTA